MTCLKVDMTFERNFAGGNCGIVAVCRDIGAIINEQNKRKFIEKKNTIYHMLYLSGND